MNQTGPVSIALLDPRTVDRLRSEPVTAPASAETAAAQGFRRIEKETGLARRDLAGAAVDLLTWRLHDRAGLQVRASDLRVHVGTVAVLCVGIGPMSVLAPCRVTEVIDEPDRQGFAYGTLPGHPERGVERFEILRDRSGGLTLRISGYSRPGTLLTRLGAPVALGVQAVITRRYMRGLDPR